MIKKVFPVQFHFLTPCTLADRRMLKGFIVSIFKKEKRPLESILFVFCDDKTLLSLNVQFLKHDYYTDILSFPLSGPLKPLIGEIYISVQRVRENAANLDSSFREELHRVILHGILHCCGLKDKTQADIRLMRKKEDRYLVSYFKKRRKN